MLATFGEQRDEQFPNVPTPTELGYKDVVITGWSGLLAPAGTPPAVVNKIYAGMAKVLAMPDVKEAMLKLGTTAKASGSPEAFARHIKAESQKYYPVIKAAGLEDRSSLRFEDCCRRFPRRYFPRRSAARSPEML